jgi:hypothetical protein
VDTGIVEWVADFGIFNLPILGVLDHGSCIINDAKETSGIQKDLRCEETALDECLSVDDSATL